MKFIKMKIIFLVIFNFLFLFSNQYEINLSPDEEQFRDILKKGAQVVSPLDSDLKSENEEKKNEKNDIDNLISKSNLQDLISEIEQTKSYLSEPTVEEKSFLQSSKKNTFHDSLEKSIDETMDEISKQAENERFSISENNHFDGTPYLQKNKQYPRFLEKDNEDETKDSENFLFPSEYSALSPDYSQLSV